MRTAIGGVVGAAVLLGAAGCGTQSAEDSVCERLRDITDAPLDDGQKLVVALERVRVVGLDYVDRLGLQAAIGQVRSEFDRFTAGRSEHGWSTRSVTGWAEVYCGGEFTTAFVMP